jgi:C4-dicarboxylate transporter DctM subunit
MSDILPGVLGFGVLLILILLRVHIGLALMVVGFVGIAVLKSFQGALTLLITASYFSVASFAFIILPLFILMGLLATEGGIGEGGYQSMDKLLARLPGGLAVATVLANTAFGAASGSSLAAASVFTKVSLPEMRKAGYDPSFACGVIATSSILAMLIPPSLLLVIYGVITETSIARLLIGGVVPGVLLTTILSLSILVLVVANPKLAPRVATNITWRERITSLKGLWGIGLLALIVLGGIYGGVFTPTEAAGAGAFAAFIITVIQRNFRWSRLQSALWETAEFTAMLFFILIGATVFSRFLTITGLNTALTNVIRGLELAPLIVRAGIMLLWLFLGCFMDAIAIMSITLSPIFSICLELGWDPIWFGIVTILCLEIGLITPPFGLAVFTVKAAAGSDISTEDIFRGGFKLFIPLLVCLILLIVFPEITLFLPNLMRGK